MIGQPLPNHTGDTTEIRELVSRIYHAGIHIGILCERSRAAEADRGPLQGQATYMMQRLLHLTTGAPMPDARRGVPPAT
jgi:hypothetical protein